MALKPKAACDRLAVAASDARQRVCAYSVWRGGAMHAHAMLRPVSLLMKKIPRREISVLVEYLLFRAAVGQHGGLRDRLL